MSQDELYDRVFGGGDFLKLLEFLSGRELEAGIKFTPMRFLLILQEEIGISFVKTRDILEHFDPDMNALDDPALINEHWREIVSGLKGS